VLRRERVIVRAFATGCRCAMTTGEEHAVSLTSVRVAGDTGFVDTSTGGLSAAGTLDVTDTRYVFVWRVAGWMFIRREWLGSS
jgi:hypothetical protein